MRFPKELYLAELQDGNQIHFDSEEEMLDADVPDGTLTAVYKQVRVGKYRRYWWCEIEESKKHKTS